MGSATQWGRQPVAALALSVLATAVVAPQASGAPPERGYELVSPAQKNKGSVLWGTGGFGAESANIATADGGKVLFNSYQSFPDSVHGQPSTYMAERTAGGWKTVAASPRPGTLFPGTNDRSLVFDATDDFSTTLYETFDNFDPLDQDRFPIPGFYFNQPDVYTRDDLGPMTWISRADADTPDTAFMPSAYVGRSADASTVYFASPNPLTANADPIVGGSYLYRRGPDGTRLVNVDSGGTLLQACGASLARYGTSWNGGSNPTGSSRNGVSADGRTAFFQVPEADARLVSGDPACLEPARLYVNHDGTVTEASASQKTTPDPTTSPAVFEAATDNGSDLFFSSGDELTDDATTGGGLYGYDVASETLTFLSSGAAGGAQFRGIVKGSDDGEYLYFIAQGQLVPGRGTPGGENLYVVHGSTVGYIGTVTSGDAVNLVNYEGSRPARVSSDGTKLAFVSHEQLTAEPNGGRATVYLYDATGGTTACVSCTGDGSAPTGDAGLQSAAAFYVVPYQHDSRNITDDGETVYFETLAALDPSDTNDALDVYEYVDGDVRLISDGRSTYGSFFFDASADGSDVFFSTASSLVGQDVDNGDTDIYDARVGGGFPPPTRPVPCSGDACQAPPTTPPTFGGSPSEGQPEDSEYNEPEVPALRLQRLSKKAVARFAKTGRVTVAVRTGGAGRVAVVATARIKSRTATVASAVKRTSRAGTVKLTLKLSRAARKQLARKRRLVVALQTLLTGAEPQRASVTLKVARKAGR